MAHRKPNWEKDGADWPHRAHSRFVEAGGLRWHVQVMGEGPPLLLLHGTGASTHSWRDVVPFLSTTNTLVIPDLPGHGFTQTPGTWGLTIPGMARMTGQLMDTLGIQPETIIGHSAGAAIALRMSLDHRASPEGVIAINGALQPFLGLAATIFPVAAKALFLNPLSVHLFSSRASSPARVAKLMESTGSRIDPAGIALYTRLLQTPGHIAGVLGMMANWNLNDLVRDLPQLKAPLTLLVGDRDKAVPPSVAQDVRKLVPHARTITLPGLGHLAHEEDPGRVVAEIRRALSASPSARTDAA